MHLLVNACGRGLTTFNSWCVLFPLSFLRHLLSRIYSAARTTYRRIRSFHRASYPQGNSHLKPTHKRYKCSTGHNVVIAPQLKLWHTFSKYGEFDIVACAPYQLTFQHVQFMPTLRSRTLGTNVEPEGSVSDNLGSRELNKRQTLLQTGARKSVQVCCSAASSRSE